MSFYWICIPPVRSFWSQEFLFRRCVTSGNCCRGLWKGYFCQVRFCMSVIFTGAVVSLVQMTNPLFYRKDLKVKGVLVLLLYWTALHFTGVHNKQINRCILCLSVFCSRMKFLPQGIHNWYCILQLCLVCSHSSPLLGPFYLLCRCEELWGGSLRCQIESLLKSTKHAHILLIWLLVLLVFEKSKIALSNVLWTNSILPHLQCQNTPFSQQTLLIKDAIKNVSI